MPGSNTTPGIESAPAARPVAYLVRGGLTALLLVFGVATADATLRIYHIDVEQGDATLFVSPSGKTLLVDSGKNGHGDRIRAVIQQAGVSRIDHFVATHYHEDHYGGVDELVDAGVVIDRAYDRGDKDFLPASKRNEARFKDYQRTVGGRAVALTRGETIPLDPEMLVTCIATGGTVLGELDPVPGADENDMSVALLIQYGPFRYFIGGDIEVGTEGKIAERDLVLDVDVYQANHHGSQTSSSLSFMEDLRPTVIVISNGNNGTYKHPRQQTLDTYANLQPRPTVFQTNKYLKGGVGGNVPDEFIADVATSGTDGTILVTVNPDTGNYTASYRNTNRSFAIKGGQAASAPVVIESLLPDPVGPDTQNEQVTLRNKGTTPASLAGWFLQDASGRVWSLTSIGTIAPQASATIKRNGMPMSLNNAGDEISLFDSSATLRDSFRYSGSDAGVEIRTGH